MGLKNEVSAIYLAMVNSGNIRVLEYPLAWGGFNLISDNNAGAGIWMIDGGGAAYGEAVPITTIPDPCWLLGIQIGIPVVAAQNCDIRISTGAAGFEVDLLELSYGVNAFPVVGWNYPTLWAPYPIRIEGQPRIAFDIRKSTANSLGGFNACHIVLGTGIAT